MRRDVHAQNEVMGLAQKEHVAAGLVALRARRRSKLEVGAMTGNLYRVALSAALVATALWIAASHAAVSRPHSPARSSKTGLVATRGDMLIRDGQPFAIRGVNYYPKDYPWPRMWESYPRARPQIERELDIAHRLGIDTVRIFVPFDLFVGASAQANLANLRDFMDTLLSPREMLAIVTLFDFYADARRMSAHSGPPYSCEDYPASRDHIRAVVNALGNSNPSVLAWDIKNEPDRDYLYFGKADVAAWIEAMTGFTRELDPHHLVTVGVLGQLPPGRVWLPTVQMYTTADLAPPATPTPCANAAFGHDRHAGTPPKGPMDTAYDPAVVAELAPLVDLVSMHYYLPEGDFAAAVTALRERVGDKPIVIEEYGLHTLSNPALDASPHTETQQAAYFNSLMALSEANGLAGTMFWTLNDFSERLDGDPLREQCMGVLRNSRVGFCDHPNPRDYAAKPAAETVRRHFEHGVGYLDLFDGWVDPRTDMPPPGWTDNFAAGGAILRGLNPDRPVDDPLWGHEPGTVTFSKADRPGGADLGIASSPRLLRIDIDRHPYLIARVSSYTIRDRVNGSDAVLHIGVSDGARASRLITVTLTTPLPATFRADLRKPPAAWHGPHDFAIRLELVPQPGANGYSASYTLDWIAIADRSFVFLPVLSAAGPSP